MRMRLSGIGKKEWKLQLAEEWNELWGKRKETMN